MVYTVTECFCSPFGQLHVHSSWQRSTLSIHLYTVPYSGKLLREKTFAFFFAVSESSSAKVFSTNFVGGDHLYGRTSNPRKFFLRNVLVYHRITKVFSLESFPLYTVYTFKQKVVDMYKRERERERESVQSLCLWEVV